MTGSPRGRSDARPRPFLGRGHAARAEDAREARRSKYSGSYRYVETAATATVMLAMDATVASSREGMRARLCIAVVAFV